MGSSRPGMLDKPREELSRRERENLRQREEILAAALSLFSERGFHNVAMHEIAKEAEFGVGTLYKYFNNKEDLYKALIMRVAREFHHAIMAVLAPEKDPLECLAKYVEVRRMIFAKNVGFVRMYFAETRGSGFNIKAGLDSDVRKLYDEGLRQLALVLAKGVKDRVFRDIDPYQMALALDGTINSLLVEAMKDPDRVHDKDILAVATDIFLRGVLSK